MNGAWLLTGEAQRWLPTWASPDVAAAGVTDPRRLLRGGSVVDPRVLVEHVYEHVTPMRFEDILANPITFHPIATDTVTGQAHDLAGLVTDRASLQSALRASICLPLLAGRPVSLGGRRWLDGGLAEPVPFRSALAGGATHLVVLRTRRHDQEPAAPSALERHLLAPYFRAFAPGVAELHATRHRAYPEDERYLGDSSSTVLQVRPPAGAHDVSRLSKDLDAIARAVQIGRHAGLEALS
ncbi:MAG: patatin [Marmoricola sp.]|nr:patatin [Marmoricola sp.]